MFAFRGFIIIHLLDSEIRFHLKAFLLRLGMVVDLGMTIVVIGAQTRMKFGVRSVCLGSISEN